MHHIRSLLIVLLHVVVVNLQSTTVVHIDPEQHSNLDASAALQMPIFLGVVAASSSDQELEAIVKVLKADLERSGQFSVTVQLLAYPKTIGEVTALFKSGYSLALFINELKDSAGIEWRLYDATQVLMIKGKRSSKWGNSAAEWAHHIAQNVWKELVGNRGPFISKIAYIKKVARNRAQTLYQLWVCDSDGAHHQLILSSNRIIVAPYWTNDSEHPGLLFSEFTLSNVGLRALDMQGNKRMVLDLEGTTVGISYVPNSSDIVYGRSGALWRYHFDLEHKKSIHSLIIKEKDACASPIVLAHGDIIYCSQGKIKYHHSDTKSTEILTPHGYCVGPAYSSQENALVYSKKVKGIMQLYMYSFITKEHVQLTHDKGDKTEACWSPCGNYIAFCWDQGITSYIATLHCRTKQCAILTGVKEHCSYPAWSPLFETFPVIKELTL